jgi:polyisoprenoid-binding protein YceI
MRLLPSRTAPEEMNIKQTCLSLALLAALAPSVHALEYKQVLPEKSSIGFSYKQMGVAMQGQFTKFTSQLEFDPEQPTKAKVRFDVDLLSIHTGSTEADAEVAGKTWFNARDFPRAHFESSGVKALGNQRYEVAGKLTIKNQTQEVLVPVTLTPQGKSGLLAGSFTIRRGDFHIGEGAWAKFDIVANDIAITFRITAATGK